MIKAYPLPTMFMDLEPRPWIVCVFNHNGWLAVEDHRTQEEARQAIDKLRTDGTEIWAVIHENDIEYTED